MLGVCPDVEENTALIDQINKASDASRQYIRDDNVLALLMATNIPCRAIGRLPVGPRVFFTGIDLPASIDSSICISPSTATRSTGMRSLGRQVLLRVAGSATDIITAAP